MKLSMYLLNDWLCSQGLKTQASIQQGNMCITGVRINEKTEDNPSTVNIFLLEDDPSKIQKIILSNREDKIIVVGASQEITINYIYQAFEYYNSWELSLLQMIASEPNLQTLLEVAHLAIHRPMLIRDTHSVIYAITDCYGEYVHPLWREYLETGTSSFDTIEKVSSDNQFKAIYTKKKPVVVYSAAYEGMMLHANIWDKDIRIGACMAYENRIPFTCCDIQLMEYFQQILNIYISAHPNILRSRSYLSEYFKTMLNNKRVKSNDCSKIWKLTNWQSTDRLVVLCIKTSKHIGDTILGRLCDDLEEKLEGSYAFLYEKRLVAIVNVSINRFFRKSLHNVLKQMKNEILHVGISHLFQNLNELPYYYKQAKLSCDAAIKKQISICNMSEIAFSFLGKEIQKNQWNKTLMHPDYELLHNYDDENATDYAASLFWYLYCNCVYTDAAVHLGIHRNTLIYRIEKIMELVFSNYTDLSERSLYILTYILHCF